MKIFKQTMFSPLIIRPTLLILMLLIALLTSQHSITDAVNPSADNFVNALLGQHKALKNELLNKEREQQWFDSSVSA